MTQQYDWPQFDEIEPWHPAFLEDDGDHSKQPGGEHGDSDGTIDTSVSPPNRDNTDPLYKNDDAQDDSAI